MTSHQLGTDDDFGKALVQSMEDFARSAPAPAFDSAAIVRRTRRRRGVLALTGSAAALAAVVTVTLVLAPSSKPAAATAPAASPAGPAGPDGAVLPTVLNRCTIRTLPAPTPSTEPLTDPAKTAIVPDLAGLDRTAAKAALASAGLQISYTDVSERSAKNFYGTAFARLAGPDGTVPTGTVLGTFPPAGCRLAPHDFVSAEVVHE
ncbi:hypothetical protein ACFW1A_04685 [Kitasatospora sp. NPDC058965]|uniref:hypothetical protein n=1 Tax=Kitasatospora sp. NPDC058965 TaxID=3346682 RepID=UPI0036C5DA26